MAKFVLKSVVGGDDVTGGTDGSDADTGFLVEFDVPSEDLPTAENLSILLESRDIYRNASTPLALVSAFIHIAVSELDLLDATTTDVTDTGRETGLNTLITLAYRHACSSYLNEGSTIVKATKAISSDRIDIIAALNRARTIASQNDAEFKDLNHDVDRLAVLEDKRTFLQFAGQQGSSYLAELREGYTASVLARRLVRGADAAIQVALKHLALPDIYAHGLNVVEWLTNELSVPSDVYLQRAPISMPLIALTQLVNLVVLLDLSETSFEQLVARVAGCAGHSQGMVPAVVVSSSIDIESFIANACKMIKLLCFLSARCQEVTNEFLVKAKGIRIAPYRKPKVQQGKPKGTPEGEAEPTVVMAVLGLNQRTVEAIVRRANRTVPPDAVVHLSLVNSPQQCVLTGAPGCLLALRRNMGDHRISPGDNQGHTQFSDRLLDYRTRFLPMSVPFHNPLLQPAVPAIVADCAANGITLDPRALGVPVFSTADGSDMRTLPTSDCVPAIVSLIVVTRLDWPTVTQRFVTAAAKGLAHVLDFGPDAPSSSASLSSRGTRGAGVNVYMASLRSLEYRQLATKPDVRTIADVVDATPPAPSAPAGTPRNSLNWRDFEPDLVKRVADGAALVSTKFARVLGKRPLVVAGMTPTTSFHGLKLVAAIANAGYHVELAGGGLSRPAIFRERLDKLMRLLMPGAGIVLNLLYLNAKQWGFQFPLALAMRGDGYPIESITVAAGVPSLDVANNIIASMKRCGMPYISFKPGSKDAILSVIAIARSNPAYPIVVQWTGGRGGGHHSYEDFHEPILATYASLRNLPNIILIAGSGFGDGVDSWPYLSGEWSVPRGYPRMPFDAILFGSRMMVAREAATSPRIKTLICDTPGVDPGKEFRWEQSYKAEGVGGVLTVTSELGEPIHKLSTRGMQLWRELDERFFKLKRGVERDSAIEKNKRYIIDRINADFQKPYFGRDQNGDVVDVAEMTYSEVLHRLVAIMYVDVATDSAVEAYGMAQGLTRDEVRHERWTPHGRWLDATYQTRVFDFLRRAEERCRGTRPGPSFKIDAEAKPAPTLVRSPDALATNPLALVTQVLQAYPLLTERILCEEDLDYFLHLCATGGKPVNFIPIIDGDLSVWFKKDSLWYSEDLAAVPEQDPHRVCVLQGPVSTFYCKEANIPAKQILDEIHAVYVEKVAQSVQAPPPSVEYLGLSTEFLTPVPRTDDGAVAVPRVDVSVHSTAVDGMYRTHVCVRDGDDSVTTTTNDEVPDTTHIDSDAWFQILSNATGASRAAAWLHCMLQSQHVCMASTWADNPLRSLAAPRADRCVDVVVHDSDPTKCKLVVVNMSTQQPAADVYITDVTVKQRQVVKGTVCVDVHDTLPVANTLHFEFDYLPSKDTSLVWQSADSKQHAIVDFFKKSWSYTDVEACADGENAVHEATTTVSAEDIARFNAAIGVQGRDDAPLDMSIVVSWSPLTKCLFDKHVTGSFLDLVHLDNTFEIMHSTASEVRYRAGDEIQTAMQITSISNDQSGQKVVATGTIKEGSGRFTVALKTTFLFRGKFAGKSFETSKTQFTVHVDSLEKKSILESKAWLTFFDATHIDVGSTLRFDITSTVNNVDGGNTFTSTGVGYLSSDATHGEMRACTVDSTVVRGRRDPVTDFFARMSTRDDLTFFESGGYLVQAAPQVVSAPTENVAYSVASKDYNAIHRNADVAVLAHLPDTIVHGMWTSAAARAALVECTATNAGDAVRKFDATFAGMVLPGDKLCTEVKHVGMQAGDKLMEVKTCSQTGATVLTAHARVKTAQTAFVFTGQGSAEVNMGMELYASSVPARAGWDTADHHLLSTYGFSILDIVRRNPNELTIHFGGRRGTKIRRNYMALQTASADGSSMEQLLPEITPTTESYTFKHPGGLLFATQFTQCALVLQEKAIFEDLQSHSLISADVVFAGHSLGEYACLTAAGNIMSVESLVEIVFLRGLVMQKAVPRDTQGRSQFGMVAVNPLRVGLFFTQDMLHTLVDRISAESNDLLQVVNYNVQDLQYVVAGHLSALDTLRVALDALHDDPSRATDLVAMVTHACTTVAAAVRAATARGEFFTTVRGKATIPLPGIDVPFHSRYLRSGVAAFRNCLRANFQKHRIQRALDRLQGRYVPNVTAQPFSVSKEYVQMAFDNTESPFLKEVLDQWDSGSLDVGDIGLTLCVELLAYQFASPVRWIESVDHMIRGGVRRFIEVGPAPTLTNMLLATLKNHGAKYGSLKQFQVLFYGRDEDRDKIYFKHDDRGPDCVTAMEAHLVPADSTAPPVATAPPPPTATAPTLPAPPTPAPATVAATAAAPMEDVALGADVVVRVLVAQKLKKPVDSVNNSVTIASLVGGKSALQNEILGELEKEFGNSPDNAAEMSIEELSKTLGAGYTPLGPVSQGHINRLLSTKLPGGFGLAAVRAHLGAERLLGAARVDGVLLVATTAPPPARLEGEAAATAWLNAAADAYGALVGCKIPHASAVAPVAPVAVAHAVPAAGGGAAVAVEDAAVAAVHVVRALLAAKLSKPLPDIGASTTIKALVGGKSAVQNEILGDLDKEFGGVPENAAEMSLQDLAQDVQGGYSPLGSVAQGLVDKIVAAKMAGGFGLARIREHLAHTWGLGEQRSTGVLLHGITMAPKARLPDDSASLAWLDTVVASYAGEVGVTLAPGGGGGGGATARAVTAGPVLSSAELKPVLQKLQQLLQTQLDSAHEYLGSDAMADARALEAETALRKQLEQRLDAIDAEHGEAYTSGIRGKFDPVMVRHYDSYWNWASAETLVIVSSLVSRQNWLDDDHIRDRRRHIVNCASPVLVHMTKFLSEVPGRLWRVAQWCKNLSADVAAAVHLPPRCVPALVCTVPRVSISAAGEIVYEEVPRYESDHVASYVRSLKEGFENVPYAYVRQPSSTDIDVAATEAYFASLEDLGTNGLSLKNKVALVTGCGQGSIAVDLVAYFLQAGARVIATTSSFSYTKTKFYQELYQQHGAKGSTLTVFPFNGGSQADTRNLIDHIYSTDKGGLALDLDFVVPFAALSENGRSIDNIDDKSELAHRIMTTNVLRLLGVIKEHKSKRGITTRPVVALLPLSPNHGLFGYDGLYAESKLGLEALVNKRASEDWADYVNVMGAVIGWTRGTGLMAGNNMTAADVETHGCRTFSTAEMAFNLFALVHHHMITLSNDAALVVDLGGGFAAVPNLNDVVGAIRRDVLARAALTKAVHTEALLEREAHPQAAPGTRAPTARAVFNMEGSAFPVLPTPAELQPLEHLRGMVDLTQTVVAVGLGEVGPWGSARTRWEMEADGQFSLEGCIEMAWLTGRIKYFNGRTASGAHHIGWVDVATNEPVAEHTVKQRYEDDIMRHSGVRVLEPALFDGYDPTKKQFMHQVALDRETQWLDVASATEADEFRNELGATKVDVRNHDGVWQIKLKKGAVISIPRAMHFYREVCGQMPTGWSAARYGIPDDVVSQVDPITLYVLVSTAEALVAAGITDPYEFYRYIHVSQLGNTMGGGLGGSTALQQIFNGRRNEQQVQGDILQESFINTMPAWVNMLLLSASGPIKTPVGACATAAESIDIAVDTIKSGKARIVFAGGYDDFAEEPSFEFASMKATSDSAAEAAMGRAPREQCRPTTTTRGGFMESQGAGVQILMDAELALEMGCPIFAIIALSSTAMDKEGRSVPAPGQGILTTCREQVSKFPSPFLDITYRKTNLDFELQQVDMWQAREQQQIDFEGKKIAELHGATTAAQFREERQQLMASEVARQQCSVRRRWGNDFFVGRDDIAPLRGALAVWGLDVDDITVASFHGTGTKANDRNESQVTQRQMQHLGRSPGNPVFVVAQKWLTGHPKGAAAAWMLNGLMQAMQTGKIPGNRNGDNTSAEMREFSHLVYPNRTIQVNSFNAGILKSFGFGQAGAEIVIVNPKFLFATISEERFQKYTSIRTTRERKAARFWFQTLAGKRTLFKAKTTPPYTPAQEHAVYINPTARVRFDAVTSEWHFFDADLTAPGGVSATTTATGDGGTDDGPADEDSGRGGGGTKKYDRDEAEALLSALRAGKSFGKILPAQEQLEHQVMKQFEVEDTAAEVPSVVQDAAKTLPNPKTTLEVTMRAAAVGLMGPADKGIGIDVEPVATFANASSTFIERNFTREEQEYCQSHVNTAAGFAGRWAAKEAVIKAISSTSKDSRSLWRGGGAPLKEIAILRSPSGAPTVVLTGYAKQVATALGVSQVEVSISHAADHAVAQAIAR